MESFVWVDINRPFPEVFRYTNENVSDWSITVIENEVLEETPEKVGSRFRMLTQGSDSSHMRSLSFKQISLGHDLPLVQ